VQAIPPPRCNARTEDGPEIRLANRRRTAHVRVGAFAFVAKLLADPAHAEPRSLSIRITHRTTGKVIAAALYQGITNNYYASHGFTGLLYSYAPGGAELQHFCHLRP
jgi:hypothetical protein